MNPGTLIASRFEVEGLVRSGGMGHVYRARDRLTGEMVALKTTRPDPDARERFAREASVLAELRHPCIVRYVAHGAVASGDLYLAMEWLPGEDLADRLARGPLAVDETIALGARVAEALAQAHARGLVHRDIKPSNIFLAEHAIDGAKLLDFGVVRTKTGGAYTRAGVVLGTPGYMSPEQARGSLEVDARTDVFALGAVLFECLAGRPLFVANNYVALQVKIVLEEAPPIRSVRPDAPPALDALLARMLAKDPAARPPDGAAVAALLAGAARDSRDSRGARASTGSLGGQGITAGEQRICSVVIARAVGDEAHGARPDGSTISAEELTIPFDVLHDTARAYGSRLEVIGDGSIVVPLEGVGAATDQAARAARCVLGMRAVAPKVAMALATGRGASNGGVPVGEVIERAARLLALAEGALAREPAGEPPVFVDELTAGLLDGRFELSGEGAARRLHGGLVSSHGGRTLLGKATPCVGRTREIGTLQAIFDECADDGVAQAVLLEGPEGAGKSRIRHELLERLRASGRRVEVWLGRGDSMSIGAPFGMLAQALRHGLGILQGEPPAVGRAKLRARLARLPAAHGDIERIATFLAELLGIGARDDKSVQLRAALDDAMLMGDQMLRAFEDLVAAECAAQPVVLVLEDLQWGDLPSVQFVDAALRNGPDHPFMVLATARPDVHQLFPALWSERVLTRVRVGELPKRAATQLVRAVLGDAVPDDAVARLVDRAGGNPFFLEELVRAHAAGLADELPETVLAMVQTRMKELPAEARRVLRAASVFGQVFWAAGVAAVLGDAARDVDTWLAHLAERELIARRDDLTYPGAREHAFRQAMVREAAYATFIDEDRALGHRLAGEWLESVGSENPVALAEHFERGRAPERALVWYRRGAEQALEGNEHAAVLARAERAIACGAAGEALGALHLLQSDAHRWLADYARAKDLALRAMQELARGSAAWLNAAGNVCIAAGLRGDVARLVDVSRELAALDDADDTRLLQVVACARATAWLMRNDELELAGVLLRRIESGIAREGDGDPAVMARVHYARAARALHDGRLDVHLALAEAAAACFERAGMLRNLCVQRKAVAMAYLQVGRNEDAERCLDLALADGARLSLKDNAADARDLLGVARLRRGRAADALALVEESVREAVARGGTWVEGRARTTLANVYLEQNEPARAELEARAALERLPDPHPLRSAALAILGRARAARGDVDGALASTEDASARLARGHGADHESAIRLARIEALRAAGREWTREAHDARERLQARAARIESAELRESFLRNIPENAQLLALLGDGARASVPPPRA